MVPGSPDTTREYRRLERNLRTHDAPPEQELNALGRAGRELVSMFFDSPLLYIYLKRLVQRCAVDGRPSMLRYILLTAAHWPRTSGLFRWAF